MGTQRLRFYPHNNSKRRYGRYALSATATPAGDDGTTPMRQGTALTTTTNASTITKPDADAQSNTAHHDLPHRPFLMHAWAAKSEPLHLVLYYLSRVLPVQPFSLYAGEEASSSRVSSTCCHTTLLCSLRLKVKKALQPRRINYASQSNRRPRVIVPFDLSILTLHTA